jgi:hypothetical protein
MKPLSERSTQRLFLVTAAAIITAGLIFRFQLVTAWHVPAGDGLQYYALSQELVRAGRFAFGPPPQPLSFARMPGYPLFLAYVAELHYPLSLGEHLVRATRWNVILDLGTGLFLALLLYERFGRVAALAGLALVFVSPTLFLLAGYGLTETFATFLGTAMLLCALKAARSRMLAWAAVAGVVAGYAHLTRTDSSTFVPAVALALLWNGEPLRRRLQALALFATCAAVVFVPWPIRNQLRFGNPHPASYQWRTNSGKLLGMGPIDWARTWTTGKDGESYIDLAIALEAPLDPKRPGILQPQMYDDEAEKQRLTALFDRYNRERLSPEVNAEFEAMAKERTRRHRLRTYFSLPLERMYHLWKPAPEWELPMRVSWMHLPQRRDRFAEWDKLLYATALLGFVVLVTRRQWRRLALILALPVVLRSLLYSYVVPLAATQRCIVEIQPLLLFYAVAGVAIVAALVKQRVALARQPASGR